LLAPIIVGVVIALVTGAWRPWHHSKPQVTRTAVSLFTPAGIDSYTTVASLAKLLHQKYSTVAEVRGECEKGSESAAFGATARCFGNNHGVYDPCFGTGRTVACVTAPWSSTVTIFTAQRGFEGAASQPFVLNSPAALARLEKTTAVWALELANGERCVLFQGAHDSVDGVPKN
jgi:hypothetical protein